MKAITDRMGPCGHLEGQHNTVYPMGLAPTMSFPQNILTPKHPWSVLHPTPPHDINKNSSINLIHYKLILKKYKYQRFINDIILKLTLLLYLSFFIRFTVNLILTRIL